MPSETSKSFDKSSLINSYKENFQTTSDTATTVFSIPVSDGESIRITGEWICITASTNVNVSSGLNGVVARRPTGGDVLVSRDTASDIQGDYSGGEPMIAFSANVGTQSIDVQLVGKSATTINWSVLMTLMRISV